MRDEGVGAYAPGGMRISRRSSTLGLLAAACAGGSSTPKPEATERKAELEPVRPHVLVVGGTGMLRRVSMKLASRGHATSVIARTKTDLADMAAANPLIKPVPVDYKDGPALEAALRKTIADHGPLALVVAWIHESAPDAPLTVARLAAEGTTWLRYLHVLSSTADDPSQPQPDRRQAFEAIHGVRYEEIVLGFVVGKDDSRWLTDAEISEGVLAAIDRPKPRSVVGTTRPWSARPSG